MPEKAILQLKGKSYEIDTVEGSEHEVALDIEKLRAETGLVTIDVGYKNTASTYSSITFLDGEAGILHHRGYSIEDLAAKSSFLEVAYLLIYGELPSKEQYETFCSSIMRHTLVHESIKKFLDAYPTNSHPMGQLSSVIGSLSAFYPDSLHPLRSPQETDLTIIRLLAKMPTMVSWIFKKSVGHPFNYPNNKLDYVSNFLYMFFGVRPEEYELDPVMVDAMNKLLILHADHEQNCSTSTVRMAGSSHAPLYACISAGISALWGSRHGGANQAVIEMLRNIAADGGNVDNYLAKVKDKKQGALLMGFGHRVYKNFDPRGKIIKKACDDVLNKLGIHDPLLEIAKKLEEAALKDSYFVERKLYPNVDFYSGIIYRAMGFPVDMFTVLFALGRLPGWIAHWREMMMENQPIARPRQIYTGATSRAYVDMNKR